MTHGVTAEVWQRLLDQWAGPLELFAAQWTDSPEDCVQEAFVQLARQTTWPDDVTAWLFRVVRNRAISLERSAQRRRKHESNAARLVPVERDGVEKLCEPDELGELLESLDIEQREIVLARVWGGLGFEQLAEVFAISPATAFRRFESALKVLRERLGVTCRR
ncbi:MAG: sigma-70 family RNA polymerase sigma factor [Planctomycetaceae bacterium]|nr:sigma-70 family RNA polymerase sigma factor [Planctomycetaceae bacterium]